MTGAGTEMPESLQKWLAFGSGIGIELRQDRMTVTAVRVRPSGVSVSGYTVIENFRGRPAAEWGAEYSEFVRKHGLGHVNATVLLPREEIIVRQLSLPGVGSKDIAAAVGFQMDSLHPYGDDEVSFGWTRIGESGVLVGILRRSVLDGYLTLFSEAGIPAASFTFSASAVYAALRVHGSGPQTGIVALSRVEEGLVEVYGESPSRPVFSAQFELMPERALALAYSELRLARDVEARRLEELLPIPRVNPVENDLSRNALPYATALAGACPRLTPTANLLPLDRRAASSQALLLPTAALAVIAVALVIVLLGFPAWRERRYLRALNAEVLALDPKVKQAAALERSIDRARDRARILDEFRGRTRADLEALNELTRLIPPPGWTSSLEMNRDSAVLQGDSDKAADLLQLLDKSPLFQNSEFSSALLRSGETDVFRIRTRREGAVQ